MTPNTLAEQTEYLSSPEELAEGYGLARVERSCPDHAALIDLPARALEVSE